MQRAMMIAICVAAAGYGGYWVVASQTASKATQNAIASARSYGFEIDYSDLKTRGFPSRIDQTATDLSVTFPDGQSGFDLPWLQLFALSYRPNHLIAAVPRDFDLRLGDMPVHVSNADLRASTHVGLEAALPVQQVIIEGSGLQFSGENWQLDAASLLAALRPDPAALPEQHLYDIHAELRDIALPADLRARIDTSGMMPEAIEGLRINAKAAFAEELSVNATPVLREITFTEASLTWGGTGFALSGTLRPDAQGRASGTVDVSLRNWSQILDLAGAAGLLNADQQRMIGQGLQLLGGNGAELTAPITLSDGQMRLGFLPLGPAPILPLALIR